MSFTFDFNFDGEETIEAMLNQRGERAARGVYQSMLAEAGEIQKLARRMAPVDEHNLEKSIKIQEIKGQRDALGRFMRGEITVYVDPEHGAHHGIVAEYAYIMHEHLSFGGSGGPLKLGKKSMQKQQMDTSVIVGGKYMERAIAEREQVVYTKAAQEVSKAF